MARLDDLKQGDKVAYTNQWYSTGWHAGYNIWQPATIEKVTATQITVKGERFLKTRGVRVGDDPYSHNSNFIKTWSEQIEKEIKKTNAAIAEYEERRTLLAALDSVKFKDLATDKLRAIAEILRPESDRLE